MVEKRKESHQMAENSIPRGKAQSTTPARRKGYFYLLLAAWWPTVKGRRWLARKGVERRLRAFEESQNCAAKCKGGTHEIASANARYSARQRTRAIAEERNGNAARTPLGYSAEGNCGGKSSAPTLDRSAA